MVLFVCHYVVVGGSSRASGTPEIGSGAPRVGAGPSTGSGTTKIRNLALNIPATLNDCYQQSMLQQHNKQAPSLLN